MDVESVVSEFYSTSDNNRRKQLQAILLKVQSEAPLDGLVVLLESDSLSVQVFVASSIHWRLTRQWSSVIEYCNAPDALLNVNALQSMLVASVQNGDRLLLPPIHTKLVQCLAAWIILTVPDLWENPVEELIHRWCPTHVEPLLMVLSEIPCQMCHISLPIDQKNNAKNLMLSKGAAGVRTMCTEIVNNDWNGRLKEMSLNCICEWIQAQGVEFSDWSTLVVSALQLVSDKSLVEPITQLFTTLCEQESFNLSAYVVGSFFHYSSNFLRPLLVSSLADPNSDMEPETAVSLLKAIVSLAESRPEFIINQLVSRGPFLQDVTCILDLLLAVSGSPGRYPVDEEWSLIPVQFWCLLEEEATCMETKLSEPIDLSKNARRLLFPIYDKLLGKMLDKMRHPLPNHLADWSMQDKETFKGYRDSLCSVVASCYRILGDNALQNILNTLLNLFKSRANDYNIDEADVCFLCLSSIVDFVSVENGSLPCVLTNVLPHINESVKWTVINRTILNLFLKATHIITHDSNGLLLDAVVGFLLPRIRPEQDLLSISLKALESLTRQRPASLKSHSSSVVHTCLTCFESCKCAKTRLMALNCIGYTLSMMEQSTIVQGLNSILSPRLQNLDKLCKESSSQVSRDDLIFELDVINSLVATIDAPTDKDSGAGCSLVLVVLEQSLPLFQSLLQLSQSDSLMCNRICACIKSGLGSLLVDASPLVPRLCHLLSHDCPPIAAVFNTARNVFVLFCKDERHCQALGELLRSLFNNLQSHCQTQSDSVEAFLSMYCQVAKKMWCFLMTYASDTVDTVLAMCCTVLQDFKESTCVREATSVCCELLTPKENSEFIKSVVGGRGQTLTDVSLKRLYVEEVVSIVDAIADILFLLGRHYPAQLRVWIPEAYKNLPSIQAIIKETANKRKCKEFVRKINLEMKVHRLQNHT